MQSELRIQRATTHGLSCSYEYRAWGAWVQGCTSPKASRWVRLGGRGLQMYLPWRTSFEAFYADMGPRPSPEHLLQLVDPNRDVEPGNLVWGPARRRHTGAGHSILLRRGEEVATIAEWAARLGISERTLYYRRRQGYTDEEVLRTTRDRRRRARH